MYGFPSPAAQKEVSRPDILERIWVTPDGREGLRALWKVSENRTGKTSQVFFQAEEGLNPDTFKAKLD